jgi:uncharacterized membrane protein YbhN (UPF0104 family)
VLVHRFGAAAFRPALQVLAPGPIALVLILGLIATVAQATRWRALMLASGRPLGRWEAARECYRAAALNTVLPGGVAGDALRAWRQRGRGPAGWRPAAACVLADRATGLCVLCAAGAIAVLGSTPPYVPALMAGVAMSALAVSAAPLRRLDRRGHASVWVSSIALLAALLAMTVVAATRLNVAAGPAALVTLGVAVLAGMAVPLNLGGWGPREAVGALAAVVIGVPAPTGVAVAAGFGLLSMVAVLPGFVVLLVDRSGLPAAAARGAGGTQVELDTDVLTDDEAPRRGAQRVGHLVAALEPDPGYAVADQ